MTTTFILCTRPTALSTSHGKEQMVKGLMLRELTLFGKGSVLIKP